jgi:hypothetical protein
VCLGKLSEGKHKEILMKFAQGMSKVRSKVKPKVNPRLTPRPSLSTPMTLPENAITLP